MIVKRKLYTYIHENSSRSLIEIVHKTDMYMYIQKSIHPLEMYRTVLIHQRIAGSVASLEQK